MTKSKTTTAGARTQKEVKSLSGHALVKVNRARARVRSLLKLADDIYNELRDGIAVENEDALYDYVFNDGNRPVI